MLYVPSNFRLLVCATEKNIPNIKNKIQSIIVLMYIMEIQETIINFCWPHKKSKFNSLYEYIHLILCAFNFQMFYLQVIITSQYLQSVMYQVILFTKLFFKLKSCSFQQEKSGKLILWPLDRSEINAVTKQNKKMIR